MPNCLIVTATAAEYAEALSRLADSPVPFTACTSTDEALGKYSDESILFGRPDMIAEILPHMPTVDWVQSTWAGVTPLIDAERRDYTLTGVKGVFGPQMSEYVIGYLLAHELKVFKRLEAQQQHHWDKTWSGQLDGKHLGILGTGSIAQHIAKTAAYFGMTVTGLSRSGKPQDGFEKVMPVEQLHDFLDNIDYLVGILPNTPQTDNLLDAEALDRLPEHAYFINIGRSNVVDDDVLIDALKNKRLAGAALDVFDEEPIPKDSALWDTPNLLITAHVAAVSYPSIIAPIFLDNYRRYTNKEPLKYVVDFAAGY